MSSLIKFTKKGIYCPDADVYIDPWRKVNKALITHGHSDHARPGHQSYLCHNYSVGILKQRLGKISVQGIEFEKPLNINGVTFTFYPAGHVVGSAQIKIENKSESWVVSGDYKVQTDGVATPFQPVKCDYFITESTFGIPAFQWESPEIVFEKINSWWAENSQQNITSIISAYSLGKAQRVIQGLDHSIGPVLTNHTIEKMNFAIRSQGVKLKSTQQFDSSNKDSLSKAIIIAPPGSIEKIKKQTNKTSIASASGWMALRGTRKRRSQDKGFVLSDHADWLGLNKAVKLTEAKKVFVTHGYTDIYSRWLNHCGIASQTVETAFEGEPLPNEVN